MILFVGAQDRGFFVKETAALKKEEAEYAESSLHIDAQINGILAVHADHIVFDIEQYVDAADVLAEEIKRIERAKNCEVIIYAPGYDKQSRVIQELMHQGIRYYIFSGNQTEAKEELERCMYGYYREDPKEEAEETQCREVLKNSCKIGIAGACCRMGTTTFAVQLVKYLQVKGYQACYVQVNGTEFVEKHEKRFYTVHDEVLGKVTFENVDMYYIPENLPEVLKQGYDYYVFDFGTYTAQGFNKTSFLEKDLRIFVTGSKAAEMEQTENVLRNEYYTDVCYVFNFISEREKADILEFMEEKAQKTFFTVYAPDQFEYVHNPEFERILPVKDAEEPAGKKRLKRNFFRRKK